MKWFLEVIKIIKLKVFFEFLLIILKLVKTSKYILFFEYFFYS